MLHAGTATTPVQHWIIDNVTRWNSDDAGTSTNRAGTSTQLNSDIDCAGTSTVDVQLYFVDVQMHFVDVHQFPDVMIDLNHESFK